VPRQSAEEELTSFVLGLPRYLRILLQPGEEESWDASDTLDYFQSDAKRNSQLIQQYEQLIRRCPHRYREYREKRLRQLGLSPNPKGRPRKDAEALEAAALKASGESWQKVGRLLGKTRDAARKHVALRRKPQGK
jgi:hypothetical protein